MSILEYIPGTGAYQARQERELRIAFHRSERSLQAMVEECAELEQSFEETGKTAALLEDDTQLERCATAMVALHERGLRTARMLNFVKELKIMKDTVTVDARFTDLVRGTADNILSTVNLADLEAAQVGLEEAYDHTVEMEERIDVFMSNGGRGLESVAGKIDKDKVAEVMETLRSKAERTEADIGASVDDALDSKIAAIKNRLRKGSGGNE